MRKLALILPLAALLGACSNFTWQGQNAEITPEEAALGLKDVATLQREYDNERNWRGLRRTIDGRTNALSRDLASVWATVDRHFFNYSASDPYVNFPTDDTYTSATLWSAGAGVTENALAWLPIR